MGNVNREAKNLGIPPDGAERQPELRLLRTRSLPGSAPKRDQYHCRSAASEIEMQALEPEWRELFAHSDGATPFLSWDFAVEWLRHFVLRRAGDAMGRFEIVTAVDDRGRTIGLAPFFEERSLGTAALGTTLQPFGRSHSFSEMTDEPIVLLRRGFEQQAAGLIRSHMAGLVVERGFDIGVVSTTAASSAARRAAFSWSDRAECVEMTRLVPGNLVLSLPASWAAFKAGLSKSMRDNVAYYPRKLSRELGAWDIRVARTPAEIAAATASLVALHRRRSRSTTGIPHGSHIKGPEEAAFLEDYFQRLARRQEISIVTISLGPTTIAAQAFVEMAGCVSVYYSGYDERWYRYSPLTVITAHVIRDAIERGFERVEFPPGETPWKSRWGTHGGLKREETSLYSTRLPALFRAVARRVRRRLRPATGMPAPDPSDLPADLTAA